MKRGLILEGGGMRGIFTAGVLDFFLDNNITFDSCIGVSAGSCHACSYLAGQRRRAYETAVNYLDDKRYCSVYSLITTGDLFGAKMLYHTIPTELNPIDNDSFLRNPAEFRAVITNCITGEAEYPVISDLLRDIEYVRASSSLPLVSRFVMLNNIPYLDGGISDSIPLKKSMELGCSKNVVVLTRDASYRKPPNEFQWISDIFYRKYPNLLKRMKFRHDDYNQTLDFISEAERSGNAFVIRPPETIALKRIEKNKEKLEITYNMGYKEAEKNFKALTEYLKI